MKNHFFPLSFDPEDSPFVCFFSKPKAPAVVASPTPVVTTAPATVNNITSSVAPPAPAKATQTAREQMLQSVPRAGRKRTMLTTGAAETTTDAGRARRTMLGTPYIPA
jgi:hypothetical protein